MTEGTYGYLFTKLGVWRYEGAVKKLRLPLSAGVLTGGVFYLAVSGWSAWFAYVLIALGIIGYIDSVLVIRYAYANEDRVAAYTRASLEKNSDFAEIYDVVLEPKVRATGYATVRHHDGEIGTVGIAWTGVENPVTVTGPHADPPDLAGVRSAIAKERAEREASSAPVVTDPLPSAPEPLPPAPEPVSDPAAATTPEELTAEQERFVAEYTARIEDFKNRNLERLGVMTWENENRFGLTVRSREAVAAVLDDFEAKPLLPEHLDQLSTFRETAEQVARAFDAIAVPLGAGTVRGGEDVYVSGHFALVGEDRNHYSSAFAGSYVSTNLREGVRVLFALPVLAAFVEVWSRGLAFASPEIASKLTKLAWREDVLIATYADGQTEWFTPGPDGRYLLPILGVPLRVLPVPGTTVDGLYKESEEARVEREARYGGGATNPS